MTNHSARQPLHLDARSRTGRGNGDFEISRHMMLATLLALALILGLGGWAVTARLSAAVIASGVVKVDRDLRPVQYLDGGALAEIAVVPGQTVEEGSLIVRFDTVAMATELAIRQGMLVDLTARAARLRAERDGMDGLLVPAGFVGDPASLDEVLRGEMMLFRTGRDQLAMQQRALELRREQLGHDRRALEARRDALEQQLRLSEDATSRTEALLARNAAPRAKLDEAIAERARIAGDLGEVLARLAANTAQTGEAELEIARLWPAARHDSHRQLREIEPRIAELQTQIAALQERIARATVRAPTAGTVNEVLVNTPGQVVGPGSTLATLVPADAERVIEFRVAPTDIDQMVPGQAARLRFPAFDQRTTPELPARVTWIAPASVTDAATGLAYFPAVATPEDGAVLPAGLALVPGMPVEVYVPTRERTMADYFLQPLRDSFGRAMREN
jgi:HlyD family secretion protein